ncbi:guanylate kinase-associated protein mars [Stomoxys calcitrans]|uniref:guanylate kinase-associated protein mars n=1 Tax=Stomoxys calcitrans TaxID=35570 RepID=UPI0027E36346|nr:guanylate kinase-associated protein mars [Stomoxys calcitrans]
MSEYRKSLYMERKEVLTPQQHNRKNRKLQEANRNKHRMDQYQLSRQISVSPTPQQRTQEEKENVQGNEKNDASSSRSAKVILTARDPEKIKKQEAFILRFLDWKDKKKALQEKKKNEANKKKPFVSVISKDMGFGGSVGPLAPTTTTAATNIQASFVPKGHHQGFQPPPGLKDPGESEKAKEKAKSRQSIYTLVPTPPKKSKEDNVSKKTNMARKAMPRLNANLNNDQKTPARSDLSNNIRLRSGTTPKLLKTKVVNKSLPTSGVKTKNVANANSASKPAAKPPINLVKNLHNNINVMQASAKTTQTRTFKMPAPSQGHIKRNVVAAAKKTDVPTNKVSKAKVVTAVRRPVEATSKIRLKTKSPTQPQKNARLTQTMKAKKPLKPPSGASTKLMTLMVTQTNGLVADMIVQTPKDFSNSNHFDDFITSTKVKNTSQTLEEVQGVSPIEMLSKRSANNSSAKRNLLQSATQNLAIESENHKNLETEKPIATKFNFIRYSEVNTSFNEENDKQIVEVKSKNTRNKSTVCESSNRTLIEAVRTEEEVTTTSNKNASEVCIQPVEEMKTPTKQLISGEEKPVNYLSPYVSVSRGKVSLKKEKEKRNSIYLANPAEEETLTVSPHHSPISTEQKSPQYSPEVRRTLEAVRYFRKQLQEEIDRLHQLCDVWEEYKTANIESLQSANCDDMIDVTVGQTRLLTSKKFMQFKGLIDRCEARATGIGDMPNDGSEKTKDVSAGDLEGFWTMLGLQVDNLEKRFENLNRWKANEWRDPDEIKPKAKPKNLTKVKKVASIAKAKSNSNLQEMLRKRRADMLLKKAQNQLVNTDDVILTPSKVRDRKYFSPAATVVAIPSSNRRLSTLLRQNAVGSPQQKIDSPNRRMSLGLRKNSQDTPNRRASMLGRKNSQDSPSLLKTVLQFREVVDATFGEQTFCGAKRNSLNAKTCMESPKVQNNCETRKSILKTPGTGRTKLKNVVFNEKLRVKKFNFLNFDDGDGTTEDCNQSNEEDLAKSSQDHDKECSREDGETDDQQQRAYTLRNRRVRLRPSCEIVIPKRSN